MAMNNLESETNVKAKKNLEKILIGGALGLAGAVVGHTLDYDYLKGFGYGVIGMGVLCM